ncbi:MAG TPA: hypothetical protein VLR27_07145 [Acidimicrobiales bacterium]|nr:hypothetical protein [Acidimicrobiales bacterium]
MRLSGLAALAAGIVLAVPACGASGDAAWEPLRPGNGAATPVSPATSPPAPLCDAIPGDLVVTATGRSPVTSDGAGTQCSWRSAASTAEPDVVLEGSFIDTRTFDVGRPGAAATTVHGIGDDAYLVEPGDGAPTTIYVRDGHRAFALWLTHPAAEGALTQLARQVLAG